jgi:xanthosine phosphorylase
VTLGDLLPLSFGLEESAGVKPRVKPEDDKGKEHCNDLVEAPDCDSKRVTVGDGAGQLSGRGQAAGERRNDVSAAVNVIRTKVPSFVPRVGLILGSGLGGIAAAIEEATAIEYGDLPGFPAPSIDGHAGRLLLGRFAGVNVACLQGRVHLYEGLPAGAVNVLPRTCKALGCEILVLTNAAGSLRPEIEPGALALIDDHINLLGQNPLVGPNDPTVGLRFPDLSEVYDPELRARAGAVAASLGIPLRSGVYLATLGPSFETPAEIRAFRALGADLVGMSTVPEAISARHCGLKVVAFSIVTNHAAGLGDQILSHEQTLAVAAGAADRLQRLLEGLLEELARDGRDPA